MSYHKKSKKWYKYTTIFICLILASNSDITLGGREWNTRDVRCEIRCLLSLLLNPRWETKTIIAESWAKFKSKVGQIWKWKKVGQYGSIPFESLALRVNLNAWTTCASHLVLSIINWFCAFVTILELTVIRCKITLIINVECTIHY